MSRGAHGRTQSLPTQARILGGQGGHTTPRRCGCCNCRRVWGTHANSEGTFVAAMRETGITPPCKRHRPLASARGTRAWSMVAFLAESCRSHGGLLWRRRWRILGRFLGHLLGRLLEQLLGRLLLPSTARKLPRRAARNAPRADLRNVI
jgi:hypothetical protein